MCNLEKGTPPSAPFSRLLPVLTLPSLLGQVAPLLAEWTFAPDLDADGEPTGIARFCYAGNDPELKGAEWHMYRQWPRTGNKLSASGDYPSDSTGGCKADSVLRYKDEKPKIGFSACRSPQVIARDLQRRFLPAFTGLWRMAEKRRIEVDDRLNRRMDVARRLLARIGGSSLSNGSGGGEDAKFRSSYQTPPLKQPGVEVEVFYYGTSDLRFSNVPEALAGRLLDVFLEWHRKKAQMVNDAGDRVKIVGLKPRSRKYPLIYVNLGNGRRYKTRAEGVARTWRVA